MSLTPGQRLGPYQVVGPIGAGGMGEVYRARDTRLQRDVALKVLPPEVSADPTRRKRFEHEARAVAALSHPHICAIYDVGAEGGLEYLVLELVYGETLAARLKRGPMPVAEALARATEIADAVASAHRAGLIHRDLKPANVMLTKAGAKVLDFGLAKIVRDEPDGVSSAAATATAPLTETGMVIGTLQYMAPEQIEGRPADARSDVFAFGAVLYEMLTARRAFESSSAAGLVGAILRADTPSVSAARSDAPASLDRLIRTCLAKDPADRLASLHDVKVALDWIQQDLARPSGAVSIASRPSARSNAWLAIAAVVAVLLAGAGYLYGRRAAPASAAVHRYVYDVALPPRARHWAGLALSPDGRHLALVTQPPSGASTDPRLWLRDLDANGDWQLVSGAGDEIPRLPFWSPDSRSLAYFVDGRLVRVDLPSLVPIQICLAPDSRGGTWLDDGSIVFTPTGTSGLVRVDARGGTPQPLADLREGEVGLKYPSNAGEGRVIYWAQNSNPDQSEIRILRVADAEHPTSIVKTTAAGVYDAGTLFYLHATQWVGESFDLASARLLGNPKPVPIDVPAGAATNGLPLVSAAAGHVAAANISRDVVQAKWADRAGTMLASVGEPAAQTDGAISPDGRRLVVSMNAAGEATSDLWIVDVETGGRRRLTTDGTARFPVWNRDNHRIAYRSQMGRGGNGNLYEVNADSGSPSSKPILEATTSMTPIGWLSENRFLFFTQALANIGLPMPRGILIREANGTVTPFRVIQGEVAAGRLSPDGSLVAYVVEDRGGGDLFVDSLSASGFKPIRAAHGALRQLQWRADGRELFYVDGDQLMAVPVSPGPAPTVGPTARLFNIASNSYVVDPRTSRFLVMVPAAPSVSSVKMTLNWTSR